MTIHFTYNKKQVIHGLRYHFLTRPEIRVLVILINVFAILSAILALFKVIQPLSFLIFSLLWLTLMFIIWRLLPSSIFRRAHTFRDEFSMSINNEAVELFNGRGSQLWPWDRFTKFVESPYFFHLYFSSSAFFLVPKDAFTDIRELQDAREILKTHIRK